jgi:hypothetical protein
MLTGIQVKRLMRRNGVTVEELAKKMQIPMNRVRKVRAEGLSSGWPHARDWIEAITGWDPGPIPRYDV